MRLAVEFRRELRAANSRNGSAPLPIGKRRAAADAHQPQRQRFKETSESLGGGGETEKRKSGTRSNATPFGRRQPTPFQSRLGNDDGLFKLLVGFRSRILVAAAAQPTMVDRQEPAKEERSVQNYFIWSSSSSSSKSLSIVQWRRPTLDERGQRR